MENQAKIIALLFAFLGLSTFSFAQRGPQATNPSNNGDLMLLQVSENLAVYKNVKSLLSFQVFDREAPCRDTKGEIQVSAEGCQVERKGEGTFYVKCTTPTAKVKVLYAQGGTTYLVEDLNLTTLNFDPQDPDFQMAYPGRSWQEPVSNEDNIDLSQIQIEEDPNLQLFMPAPIVYQIYRDRENTIQANWNHDCQSQPRLSLEGEGAIIKPLDKWNQYSITPDPATETVRLRFYTEKNGQKSLLREMDLPVSDVE